MMKGIARPAAASLAALLLLAGAAGLSGQEGATFPCPILIPGGGGGAGEAAEWGRVAELSGHVPVEPRVIVRVSDRPLPPGCAPGAAEAAGAVRSPGPASPRLRLLPARLRTAWSSAYAWDRHDGPVWTGRGATLSVQAGATAEWGPIDLRLAPVAAYQQNRPFATTRVELTGYDPMIHPWYKGRIDLPQRFGEEPFAALHPGGSALRVTGGGFRAGAATEAVHWGPALRNPLLLGGSGPGFPHLFLGTAVPFATPVGAIEAELLWGRLRESRFFDADAANDTRLLTGLIVDLAPRGLSGLVLGFARLYLRSVPPEGLDALDYVPFLEPSLTEVPVVPPHPDAFEGATRMVSLFGRWAMPEAGFELYGEWAWRDPPGSLEDALLRPEEGSGWTAGLQSLLEPWGRPVRVLAEVTRLVESDIDPLRLPPSFYTHPVVTQGFTHRGQLLGASVGPGADAEYVALELPGEAARTRFYIERVRRAREAYLQLRKLRPPTGTRWNDLEITAGLERVQPIGRGLYLHGRGQYSQRRNRDFVAGAREGNWLAEAVLVWRPAAAAR